MMPIRIMTRQFELLGEIDRYSSLQITRSWHGIGAIELRINRYLKGADKLQRGHIFFPHNHLNKAYQIKHREIELDQNGKQTENWLIRALPIKSWLGQRITYPPAHTANDNRQADAETVMRHYVTNNVINPVDVYRRMEDIILDINQVRGDNISWQSRYKNLAEETAEISLLSGLGWNVDIDYELKNFVFKVLEGRNLTSGQSILPPAIFSPEFGTLKQLSYLESELNYKNFAIVAGQGEGVERRIVEVGNSSGIDRYELFVDARDVSEETDREEGQDPIPRPPHEIVEDLTNRGNQKLAEYEQEIYLEGQALSKSRLVYGKDYDLGDMVTLQNKHWGVTMDARITEVKEIYEPEKTGIELIFGNDRPTLMSKIKQELAGLQVEMTR